MLSFETAKRLREAGFPQPKPGMWQVWYDTKGDDYLCLEKNYYIEMRFFERDWVSDNEAELFIFAPTAADITKEIHRLVGQVVLLCFDGGEWIVRRDIGLPELEDMTIAHYPDPDEAAANAFFEAAAVTAKIDAIIAG